MLLQRVLTALLLAPLAIAIILLPTTPWFAAICAAVFRVNLPLAVATTLYTNPLTIVPLYIVAFALGGLVIESDGGQFVAPPGFDGTGVLLWMQDLMHWMADLGKPLFVGLILLAVLFAAAGYVAVRALWRLHLVRAWRTRTLRRASPATAASSTTP